MFAYLIGTVAEVSQESLVLEVNRIGYHIRIPASAVSLLPPVGEEVKIYTYTSVREDAIALFGFLRKDDLEMYRQLINVSGIGPKAGLSVLSVLSADEIRLAVISQDEKAIAKAPGIGRKTAQRIILELKDRISLEDAFSSGEEAAPSMAASATASSRPVMRPNTRDSTTIPVQIQVIAMVIPPVRAPVQAGPFFADL